MIVHKFVIVEALLAEGSGRFADIDWSVAAGSPNPKNITAIPLSNIRVIGPKLRAAS
jgi:hypothetical protein